MGLHGEPLKTGRGGWRWLAIGIGLLLLTGPATAQDQPKSEVEELRRQLQAERAARKALTYQADMRKAGRLAEVEDWPGLRAVLDVHQPAAGEPDPRSWEWRFLDSVWRKNRLVDRHVLTLQGPSEGIRQLAWCGNGERLAAVGEDGAVILWNAKTGRELRRFGSATRFVALDRDGHRLAVSAENHTVTLWEVDTGRVRRFFGPYKGLFYARRPAFGPDGKLLALSVNETSAAIVNATTGRELQRLPGHKSLVSVVAWSDTGEQLATGTQDGTIKVWEAANGKEIAGFAAAGEVLDLSFGPGGRQVAAVVWPSRATRLVQLWEVGQRDASLTADYPGGPFRPIQHAASVTFSADGARIAAESEDGVAAWETATERLVFRGPTGSRAQQANACDPQVRRWALLEMFGSRATGRVLDMDTSDELMRVDVEIPINRYQAALAWSPDGRRLAAGFSNGKVYVYNPPNDRSEVRIVNAGPAPFFEWSPDGKQFALSAEGEIRLGRLPTAERPHRLGAPLLLPKTVSLSPDGKLLAGADHDGTLPIWNVGSGQIVQRLAGHPPLTSGRGGENDSAPAALLWSPDGRRLASIRLTDGGVRVWEVETGRVLSSFQFGANTIDSAPHDALPFVWSRDSKLLAARIGWQQKTIRVLDVIAGRQTREWDGGPSLGSSNAMAWDPAGRRLATCLGNPPAIQLWAMTSGADTSGPKERVLGLHAIFWSPDGRRLAYLVEKWQVYDLVLKRGMSVDADGKHLAWSPDGSEFVVFNGQFANTAVEFHDAATGKVLADERGWARPDTAGIRLPPGVRELSNFHVQSVVWGKEGLFAAAGAMPYPGWGVLVVWKVRTGKLLWSLSQAGDGQADRAGAVRLVAWAPDGRSLATLARENGQVDLWDVATSRKTRTLKGGHIPTRGAAALAWSPDGRSLALAGEAVGVWKLALPDVPVILRPPPKGGSGPNQTFLAWSADSTSLAVLECRHSPGHEAALTAWDFPSGRERFHWTRPFEYSELHTPIAWSPDGRRMAWGGPKPAVWNVAESREEFPLSGHSHAVIDVGWSADGRRVWSRSEAFVNAFTSSFELKVWDSATAQEVLMIRGPMAGWLVAPGFLALASPPGKGSDAGNVIVWDLGARR
jgi:WD40 repeat protein